MPRSSNNKPRYRHTMALTSAHSSNQERRGGTNSTKNSVQNVDQIIILAFSPGIKNCMLALNKITSNLLTRDHNLK